MRLASGEELLTIKDIAECIAFGSSDANILRALRQVRHWTQHDLLKTVSEKKTGKGVPRFYSDEPTLQVAAVLAELSRYSITLEVLKPVADELYFDWDDGSTYLFASLTDVNVFMQVSWTSDEESGRITGAKIKLFTDNDWLITGDETNEDETFDATLSSSVLINMTEVMDRVYGRKFARLGDPADD